MLKVYIDSPVGKMIAVIVVLGVTLFGLYFRLFTVLSVGILCAAAGIFLLDAFLQHRKEPMAWLFVVLGFITTFVAAPIVWSQ